jgi:hypothetical protein
MIIALSSALIYKEKRTSFYNDLIFPRLLGGVNKHRFVCFDMKDFKECYSRHLFLGFLFGLGGSSFGLLG